MQVSQRDVLSVVAGYTHSAYLKTGCESTLICCLPGVFFSVFMIDKEEQQLRTSIADGTQEIVLALTAGIVGHVTKTGTPLNIPDAYRDPRFDRRYFAYPDLLAE